MRTHPVYVLAARSAWLALLVGLASCSSVGKLTGASPVPTDLSGTWKLNRNASDDPAKVFEKLRGDHERRERESQTQDADASLPGERRPGSGQSEDDGSGGRGRDERRERKSPGEFFDGFGTGRGLLRIAQRPADIVIDNGVSSRKFVPGATSVVSVKGGVADQTSGWDGKDFVIDTTGRNRPEIIERYAVAPDRRSLTVAIKISGHGQMPTVEWKLVYDAAPADAEREGPST
jgi:hypothetical protein